MSARKIETQDIEAAAKSLGIVLKSGDSKTIASVLSEVRQNVFVKASALAQDAPLSVYFDAR